MTIYPRANRAAASLLLLGFAVSARALTPIGTKITNQVTATYQDTAGQP